MRGFTLLETLVAASIIVLVGTFVGRLAYNSREAISESQMQSQAAQILARLGNEAQRGNPTVVPLEGNRSLDGVALSNLLGRDTSDYRAEVQSQGGQGLRDYDIQVCWRDGCIAGKVKGPPPLAGVAGNPPARVVLGGGTLEIIVLDELSVAPSVHISNGNWHEHIQRWGVTRFENLPSGNYAISALGIRDSNYTYEAPPATPVPLQSGTGARVSLRYQPTSGAISVSLSAPAGMEPTVQLNGSNGAYSIRNSQLIPYLPPGNYSLAATPAQCGDYTCTPRITGSPVTLTVGETHSITVAYEYASGNLQVNLRGVTQGKVGVKGPNGYQRLLDSSITLHDLAPGRYRLEPAQVKEGGYTYQAQPQEVEVRAGETAQARIDYAAVSGRLKVQVEASQDGNLGRITQNEQSLYSFGRAGGEWELTPGIYQVVPNSFIREGYLYEAPTLTAQVRPGETESVVVSFQVATAILDYSHNLPRPYLANALLKGPAGYQRNLPASDRLTLLRPGVYNFEAHPVEIRGYIYLPTPDRREIPMVAGQRYVLDVDYRRQQGQLALEVRGLPTNLQPTVLAYHGEQVYGLQAGLNPDKPTGDYVIEAKPIEYDGFAYLPRVSPARFTLSHEETITIQVEYVRQSGTLHLRLEGLPQGEIRLEGPSTRTLREAGDYILLPGNYQLSASPLERDGFRYEPIVENGAFQLAVGQEHTATVRYVASTARLEIQVRGVSPPTPLLLQGSAERLVEGPTTLEFLPPGNYTLTPQAVQREEATSYGRGQFTYRAAPLNLSLEAGVSSQAEIVYVRQHGRLEVQVAGLPENATPVLRLTGMGLDHEFPGGTLEDLPTGNYTLTPKPVRSGSYTYRAMAQSFTLAHQETEKRTVSYQAATGALQIVLEGAPEAKVRVWQENQLIVTTGSTTLEDLLPGVYRLEPLIAQDHQGFEYRAQPQEVEVVAGQTAQARLRFIKQSAFVDFTVEGAPSSYALYLEGPHSYSFTTPGRYEVASGAYQARARDLTYAGFTYRATVEPTEFSLSPGQNGTVRLVYKKVAAWLRFELSGLPSGVQAHLELSGPSDYSASLGNGSALTPDLLPGTYTLRTPDLAASGYTYRANGNAGTYVLEEGQVKVVALHYTPITGRVQVKLEGVPNGASPSLRILPAGINFSQSQAFELLPGRYTLEASPFQHGGYSYTPSGQGAFEVTVGQTTYLTVRYQPVSGRLRVVTTGLPFNPDFGLQGPKYLKITTSDQIFDDLPPGLYTAFPRIHEQNVGNGVVYRFRPGNNLVGQGEVTGVTTLGLDSYRLNQRDGFPGGWINVKPNQLVGVAGCIQNQSTYPAQIGFVESLADGSAPIWTASGWQRGQWVRPGQSGCISTTLQTSNRNGLRLRPYVNIDGPWNGVGGTATITRLRVSLLGEQPSIQVRPGETSILYVHYTATGSVILQINRTSDYAPVEVRFNNETYTTPGRYVVNFLEPGNYPLTKKVTYNYNIAFHPKGPDAILLPGGAQTVEAVITYVPENKAALLLEVVKNYSGSDPEFLNSTPEALLVLRNGTGVYWATLGRHTISLFPWYRYRLNRQVGYTQVFKQYCGLFGCWRQLYWKLERVEGLPLIPRAGQVYNARAVWRGVVCEQNWFSWVCREQ